MSYTVQGYLDGISYAAQVGAAPEGNETGIVTGSPRILAHLVGLAGQEMAATPTSEGHALDLRDERAILHALMATTTITDVSGDAPKLHEDDSAPLDAIY